jgi:pilus assembly protein Flp/PilA
MVSRTNTLLNGNIDAPRERSRRTTTSRTAWRRICRFLSANDGPTAVEYGVMLMLILAVCITAVGLIGQQAQGSFSNSANSISNAITH